VQIDSVLDDNDDRVPTVKDIPKLEYTERVFAESMRLYPPAWATGRQATNDCKIGDYVISAGSSILMSQYLIHQSPEPIWFLIIVCSGDSRFFMAAAI
jgi:cytochrome P450